jgi:hypothetical protein
VGALVVTAWGVGVADGGNQICVDVGSGVSVGLMGVDVAGNPSIPAHEARSIVIMRRRFLRCAARNERECLKVIVIGDIFSFQCVVK